MADPFHDALLAVLAEHGLTFVAACWRTADPDGLSADVLAALDDELAGAEAAPGRGHADGGTPVASLVSEVDGEPSHSARYRHEHAPAGLGEELRFAFVDGEERWGSMGLFRDESFSPSDLTAAAALVPVVSRVLHAGLSVAAPAPRDPRPGVFELDAEDGVRRRDAGAMRILGALHELPGAILLLAARARRGATPVFGRTLTEGGAWLGLEAHPALDDPGAVTVVVRPAPAPSVPLQAAGLSPQEREIALALLRGEEAPRIAEALQLPERTVRARVEAIFDKTGVRSRRAFVARWALEATTAG